MARDQLDQLDQPSSPTGVGTPGFPNGHETRDTDEFIAVIGMTGAGKSTLINLLTTQAPTPAVGNGLSPCTKELKVFRCDYSPGRAVYLIDTPGFDGNPRSTANILRILQGELEKKREKGGIRLVGILYLHRITDPRVGGSAKRNLTMFRQLCRSDDLRSVILVTTMWSRVQQRREKDRETQLKEDPEFWGSMMKHGSRVERHTGDRRSAQKLVKLLLKSSQRDEPAEAPLETNDKRLQKCLKRLEDLQKVLLEAQEKEDKELEEQIEECVEDLDRHYDYIKTIQKNRPRNRIPAITSHSQKIPYGEDPEVPNSAPKRFSDFLIFKRAPSSRYFPGSNWFKRPREDISLSLRGSHGYFTGPAYSTSHLAPYTLNALNKLPSSENTQLKRFVLGEGLAHYVHYHEGSLPVKCCHDGEHLQTQYPGLFEFLGEDGNLRCPASLSLGPAGSYFIRIDGRRSFQCHPNAPIESHATSAARLWWGVDGAYVLEQESTGELLYDLRGYYGDLKETLKKHKTGTKIWDLALNIADSCSFAIVFKDRPAFQNGMDGVIHSLFDEYANMNSKDM